MFSLPWPPARSLRLGERDVFEPAGLVCYGAAPPDQLGNQSKPGLGRGVRCQAPGYWLLVTGLWLLVTGYWPEARSEKPATKTLTPLNTDTWFLKNT